ncbi:MAG TPA: ribosome small subunit-dependent GTPase A, partial [Longimicrobiales bacterium]
MTTRDFAPQAGPGVRGVVRKAVGGVYEVRLPEGDVVEARLRGRLKLEQRTGDAVAVGDRVDLRLHPDGGYTIEAVHPRDSELARRSPGGGRRAKVIVANVDQVVIVLAAARPEPHLRMLDRFLVLCEANFLPAIIVVNKTDLVPDDEVRARFAAYAAAGYRVLPVSVRQDVGVDEVRALLCGRTSVLTGPSGVGKSSLLNTIQPGLALRTGEVSEAVGKGQHTTVSAELVPLECGGYVADTPGLREVGLWEVPVEELDTFFPEFEPYLGHCRFTRNCTHTHEPDCAVRDAVAAGEVST